MLAIQGTVSYALRNKRLAVSKTAQDGDPVPYVPEEWVTFEQKFIYSHGWAERDRGRGERPRHHVRTTGCPFRFTVQMRKRQEVWRLQVQTGVYEHNHVVNEDVYESYPSNRKIRHRETRATVDAMIQEILQEDQDNVISVDDTDIGHTGVIRMTTAHMRRLFSRFPELILVDCTHNTNRPILSMLTDFYDYFIKNWHRCKYSWNKLTRQQHENLATDTNNDLESFFGKIKKEVSALTDMRTLFQTVWNRAFRDQHEYVQEVNKVVTMNDLNAHSFTEDPEVAARVRVQVREEHELINVKTLKCTCTFATSLKLPCKHMIAYRKTNERFYADVVPIRMINDRSRPVIPKKVTDDQEDDKKEVKASKVKPSEDDQKEVKASKVNPSRPTKVQSKADAEVTSVLPKRGSSNDDDNREGKTDDQDDGQAKVKDVGEANNGQAKTKDEPAKSPEPTRRLPKRGCKRKKRAEFMAGLQIRRSEGGVSLVQFARAIASEKPGLKECSERVARLPVRFAKFANRKPKLVTKPNAIRNADAFNLLPKDLLKSCVAKLPVCNTSPESPMPIVISQASNPSTPGSDSERTVQCVSIASVGTFSEEQIRAMMMLSTIKKRCKEGSDAVRWLWESVASDVDADKQEEVNSVADWLDSQFSMKHIPDIPGVAFLSSLYRLRPPAWLNDDNLFAFCDRLCADYTCVAWPGEAVVIDTLRNTRGSTLVVEKALLGKLSTFKRKYDDDMKKKRSAVVTKLVIPLGQRDNYTTFQIFHIDAEVVPKKVHTFNCGVFVCMKFFKFVEPDFRFFCTKKTLALMRYCMAKS
ncbi:TPA: hypothetical protein N0F65_010330 [Lagenidium giganteum]|uniref:SWIM-type domain-containing protein n=1 Tax=Lagenidium giganteum TaxID=4803 RepID=A0AAV2Z8E0_9STRA|nr:TPA: hypothetical protein N0F65_010330 [Lagenidium giganteum]